METTALLQHTKTTLTHSISLKLLAIACLVGALLLPSQMIQSLIKERETRKAQVLKELSAKWGNEQTINGPILTLPYRTTDDQMKYLHVLPEEIAVTSDIRPEVRYRGIFEAVLYGADIQMHGIFRLPDAYEFSRIENSVQWTDAVLALGISDVRGITENIQAEFDDAAITLTAGKLPLAELSSGVKSKVSVVPSQVTVPFSFRLQLNGNRTLNVVPVGSVTTVTATSSWNSPSFNGASLPMERTISGKGFQAVWSVLEVNRDYPQFWVDTEYALRPSAIGVSLLIPVEIYQKSMRAVKYSFIFVILTFAVFFFAEIMHNYRIHPIQYLLIGFAVMVFYTLLLSISEHIRFAFAYLAASAGVTLLITAYAQTILDRRSFTLSVFGLLSGLYGYLYVLLQMEDYSLLSGSIGVFALLCIIMFATRKVNWYALNFGQPTMEESAPFDALDLRPPETDEIMLQQQPLPEPEKAQ